MTTTADLLLEFGYGPSEVTTKDSPEYLCNALKAYFLEALQVSRDVFDVHVCLITRVSDYPQVRRMFARKHPLFRKVDYRAYPLIADIERVVSEYQKTSKDPPDPAEDVLKSTWYAERDLLDHFQSLDGELGERIRSMSTWVSEDLKDTEVDKELHLGVLNAIRETTNAFIDSASEEELMSFLSDLRSVVISYINRPLDLYSSMTYTMITSVLTYGK